jgi:putative peptidoglycan lipid II flippase
VQLKNLSWQAQKLYIRRNRMFKQESIKRGSAVTLVLNLFGKGLGFLSTIFVSIYFGANHYTDIYYFLLSFTFLLSTLIVSPQNNVLVPFFLETKEKKGEKEAWALINHVFSNTVIASIVVSILFFVSFVSVIATCSNFSVREIQSSSSMIVFFAPVIFGMLVVENLRIIIQANQHFTIPALATLINNVLLLAAIIFFGKHIGIISMSLALMISYVIQVAIMYFFLKKHVKLFRFQVSFVNADVKQFYKNSLPVFLSQVFGTVSIFFYDYVSTKFPSGTLTGISYAQRLFSLPDIIIFTPVIAVLAPFFAQEAAQRNFKGLLDRFYKYNQMIWLVAVPISVLMIFNSYDIINLLYSSKKFGEAALVITSNSLRVFSIGLIAIPFVAIYTRLFFALQKNKLLSISSVVIGSLSIILTLFLEKRIGYLSISISRTLSLIIFSFVFGIVASIYVVPGFKAKQILLPLAKYVFIALLAWGMVHYIYEGIFHLANTSIDNIFLKGFVIAGKAIAFSILYGILLFFLLRDEYISRTIMKTKKMILNGAGSKVLG